MCIYMYNLTTVCILKFHNFVPIATWFINETFATSTRDNREFNAIFY